MTATSVTSMTTPRLIITSWCRIFVFKAGQLLWQLFSTSSGSSTRSSTHLPSTGQNAGDESAGILRESRVVAKKPFYPRVRGLYLNGLSFQFFWKPSGPSVCGDLRFETFEVSFWPQVYVPHGITAVDWECVVCVCECVWARQAFTR